MSDEQKAAYIFAQSACMLAELEGMKAANRKRDLDGVPRVYGESDFAALPNKYGIHHNACLTLFHGA